MAFSPIHIDGVDSEAGSRGSGHPMLARIRSHRGALGFHPGVTQEVLGGGAVPSSVHGSFKPMSRVALSMA
jgi:hypothetical protein